MVSMFPLQFGIPGGPELLVILLIAVLLFGANKIPKLARSTGEAMGEFQKGREEVEQELQEMREGPADDGSMEVDEEPTVETAADEEPTVETAADEEPTVDDVDGEPTVDDVDEERTDADEETDDGSVGIEDAEADEETN